MKQDKRRSALRRMKVRPVPEIDRSEMDKNIFDAVLNYLYINADKNSLDLNDDVLSHMSIKLPQREKERIWGVLTSSGWLSPKVGFGNAGKVELTKAGFQLMSQFGSYSDYLAAMHNNPAQQAPAVNQPQAANNDDKTVPGQQNGAAAARKQE